MAAHGKAGRRSDENQDRGTWLRGRFGDKSRAMSDSVATATGADTGDGDADRLVDLEERRLRLAP
jgi:hypothetical protein